MEGFHSGLGLDNGFSLSDKKSTQGNKNSTVCLPVAHASIDVAEFVHVYVYLGDNQLHITTTVVMLLIIRHGKEPQKTHIQTCYNTRLVSIKRNVPYMYSMLINMYVCDHRTCVVPAQTPCDEKRSETLMTG